MGDGSKQRRKQVHERGEQERTREGQHAITFPVTVLAYQKKAYYRNDECKQEKGHEQERGLHSQWEKDKFQCPEYPHDGTIAHGSFLKVLSFFSHI